MMAVTPLFGIFAFKMGRREASGTFVGVKHAPQDAIRYLLSPGLRRHPSGLEADCPGALDCLEHVTAP